MEFLSKLASQRKRESLLLKGRLGEPRSNLSIVRALVQASADVNLSG